MYQIFVYFKMWNSFMHILFPRVCITCGEVLLKEERHLCLTCFSGLPQFLYPAESYVIRESLQGKILFQSAFSWLKFNKGGHVQDLLHQIKYGGDVLPAQWAGRQMAAYWQESGLRREIDFLVPVPIHPRKRRTRGYNQSEEIAKGFSEISGVGILEHALDRTIHSSSNTLSNRWERAEKMKEVFRSNPFNELTGRRIGLIDDVLTTGATIEACAKILWEKGISELNVLTLARTV